MVLSVQRYLGVEEAKELGESVADVSETQQHQRYADNCVRDAHDPTPECLGRYVPVACKHHSCSTVCPT